MGAALGNDGKQQGNGNGGPKLETSITLNRPRDLIGRPLRVAMIGGGPGSFIGPAAHLPALKHDNQFELAAGVFSRNRDASLAAGKGFGVEAGRTYENVDQLIEAEMSRPDGIDLVTIVVPNSGHAPIAKKFLDAGINVMLEKPMAMNVPEARELVELAASRNAVFTLAHNYSANPMVVQAIEMIRTGAIGDVRLVRGEYTQGWLSTQLESTGQKQAAWRTDPSQAGVAGAFGDIGTHIFDLTCRLVGADPLQMSAFLNTSVPGRNLDDSGSAHLVFPKGVVADITASQVSLLGQNGLKFEVSGSTGALAWEQEHPNQLKVVLNGGPVQIYERGTGYLSERAKVLGRTPPGHPVGYTEGFANLYLMTAHDILRRMDGKPTGIDWAYPNARDGLRETIFLENAVMSSTYQGKLLDFTGGSSI